MKTSELIATLVLPKLPKIGCRTARKLIRHFGSAEAVFQHIGRENTKSFNAIAAVFKRPETKHIWDAAEKVSELSSLLFQLEMKGVVMAQAGKLFKLL